MSDRCDLKKAGLEESAKSLREEKRALRKEKLALRRALSPGYRIAADRSICHELLSLIREKGPSLVAAYVTDGDPALRVPAARLSLVFEKRFFGLVRRYFVVRADRHETARGRSRYISFNSHSRIITTSKQ